MVTAVNHRISSGGCICAPCEPKSNKAKGRGKGALNGTAQGYQCTTLSPSATALSCMVRSQDMCTTPAAIVTRLLGNHWECSVTSAELEFTCCSPPACTTKHQSDRERHNLSCNWCVVGFHRVMSITSQCPNQWPDASFTHEATNWQGETPRHGMMLAMQVASVAPEGGLWLHLTTL